MVLFHIFLATLAGGVLSVLLAATLALTWLPRFADRMVAYAVGVLLAFAFTSLLPEVVALGLDAALVGQILLAAIAVFFLRKRLRCGVATITTPTASTRIRRGAIA